ncbi:lysosomal acid phosphatase-like protein 3 [Leptotrombidium deliense]|uniref:Lysosomal acid phosphatase-like protein 3 n=1 Tax=Leptotrombidium deliense TaxID=299467 RepID=A0A443SAT9_9ACAR|nr:lysosomal acid phosphatase-like protein 3 [Leptotrombidium deliense]
MQVLLKLMLLCAFVLLKKTNVSANKLKSFHRHGDRTALETYNDDPNTLYWVKHGLGRLTDKGEQRMKHLGEFLRKRYGTFWPTKENLYIRSSREVRCVDSVKHLISGAYNNDFLSDPVKINNIALEDDIMLSPGSSCPAFDQETIRVSRLPENQQWIKTYSLLVNKFGSQHAITFLSLPRFLDNFELIKEYNLTMPNWINDTIYQQINDYSHRRFTANVRTILQRRLRAGLFLKELYNQMNLIERNEKFNNIRIYSSSQLQVAEILTALGVYNNEPPPFGSTIMFELYKTHLHPPMTFVKLYYLNDTYSENPHLLTIEDCIEDEFCSFLKVKEQIEKYIPNDSRIECGLQ